MLVGLGILGVDGAAEGGHLHRLLAEHHMHQAEAPADDAGAAEHALHLFGRSVGGHVEILGFAVQQQVAHRAADHEGLEAGGLQPVGDAFRAVADAVAAHAMFFIGNHVRRTRHTHRSSPAEHPFDQSFYHRQKS